MEIVVGIDVSKERLDVAILPQEEVFAVGNDHAGIDELVERLKASVLMRLRWKRPAASRCWRLPDCPQPD